MRLIGSRAGWLAAAVIAAGSLPALAQDTHLGRNLAATCANCHGTDGRAVGEMKSLAGLPAATIMVAIAEFKDGRRPATVMHQIAKGYTDEQIRLIAAYFAAQGPSR